MAANNGKNKRIPIKWIRDGAKSAYDKKDVCFICNSTEELELHHTNGLTNLLTRWATINEIPLDTDEQVLEIRDRFISEHRKEIYDDVYTLCVKHHRKLHDVYGVSPDLSTALKQASWIQKQKQKEFLNVESKEFDRESGTEVKSSSRGNVPAGRFSAWY
jgi:hypothetical protein